MYRKETNNMGTYKSPGVYVETADTPTTPISALEAQATAAFVGKADRGTLNTPVICNSWQSYVDSFARGLPSAFNTDNTLAYSVYSFFSNGGSRAYIVRAGTGGSASSQQGSAEVASDAYTSGNLRDVAVKYANSTYTYSVGKVTTSGNDVTLTAAAIPTTITGASDNSRVPAKFKAKDIGAWGNKLSLLVEPNVCPASIQPTDVYSQVDTFNVTVFYDGDAVEKFMGLNNDNASNKFFATIINSGSKYITVDTFTDATNGYGYLYCTSATALLTGAEPSTPVYTKIAFTSGTEVTVDNAAYETAIDTLEDIDDIGMLAVPDSPIDAVQEKIKSFCIAKGTVFAILDFEETVNTADAAIAANYGKTCDCGAIYYGWLQMNDPSGKNIGIKNVPPSGHVAGVISKTIMSEGAWKAAGGIRYPFSSKSTIGNVWKITQADCDKLNPANINCVMNRAANNATCIWGIRSLNTDREKMKYVSDVLLNIYVKRVCKSLLEQYVFDPNNAGTWSKVCTTLCGFLGSVWNAGGLKGSSASQAYQVKCDAEINTNEMQNAGILLADVAYAPTKPAEYVVVRLSVSVNTLS